MKNQQPNTSDKIYSIETLISESRLKVKEIVVYLDIRSPTWYRRLSAPEEFTVKEINKLATLIRSVRRDDPLITPAFVFEVIQQSIVERKSVSNQDNPSNLIKENIGT